MARPSSYAQKIANEICARLAEGETLTAICADAHMPTRATVWNWRESTPAFFDAYVRAREAQMEAWADEIMDVSDDGSNDWMEKRFGDDKESTWVLNGEHVQRSRLRVDTRKFLMSKIAPQRYGDKIAITGPEGGPVQYQEIERRVVKAGHRNR